jgi:hypothetical protein
MTIGSEPIVLDTNIWIFGLREQQDRIHCSFLLQQIPHLYRVYLPRQILRELQANLSDIKWKSLFCPHLSPLPKWERMSRKVYFDSNGQGAILATRQLPPMLKALGQLC